MTKKDAARRDQTPSGKRKDIANESDIYYTRQKACCQTGAHR